MGGTACSRVGLGNPSSTLGSVALPHFALLCRAPTSLPVWRRYCTNAAFLVTHNNKETRYWRVIHERMPMTLEEIENIPHADASDKQVRELPSRLKVFKEDEFANLLHQCHNVIRNREKKDPAAAFDEIAKILFIKVCIERRLRAG